MIIKHQPPYFTIKKSVQLIILIALAGMVSSCATIYITGNNYNENLINEIEIGETDKTQITNLLGQPYQKGKINHADVFIYSYEETKFPPDNEGTIYVDRHSKSLYIVFDENGLVQSYTQNIPVNTNTLHLLIHHERKKQEQREEEEQ